MPSLLGASSSDTSKRGSTLHASFTMASRSAKLAVDLLGFRGCRPTGAKKTLSRSNTAAAAVAMAIWPWCGGSKLPPKRAMRMAILPADWPATLRKVDYETHADLFDRIVVAVGAERVQAAVA